MNYTNVKEEGCNIAHIAGVICSDIEKTYEVEGEGFFEFKVEVERLSKIKDIIPVTLSERSVSNSFKKGDFVDVVGEYRSYNKIINDKSRLILHLFAKEAQVSSTREFVNEVKLVGFVCKEPVYRKTPFEREICDILLAVNRFSYHKSDYVPCILWGRNARYIASQPVGTKVEVVGRIQSREYTKSVSDEKQETKTAYEVSCQKISVLSNLSQLPVDEKVESSAAN